MRPRTLGIVGGIGPESTIDYYRTLIARFRQRTDAPGNPHVVIYSIDIRRMLDDVASGDLDRVVDYIGDAIDALASAGAELALLAANTPHIVFPQLAARAPIPLVSIVDATCERAVALGLSRLAILGTRFTMEGSFYPDVLRRHGASIVTPDERERAWIHEIYMSELVAGRFLPETRMRLLEIIDNLCHRDGIDGVILGGTELPLLLRDQSHNGIALLDTTAIHVDKAIDSMLAGES